MAYLREAVERQREYIINQLVTQGYADHKEDLRNKTISELIIEYDQFKITLNKSTSNPTKSTSMIENDKRELI